MNIKSLLIGSAAALVAVSGARAADAVVAEPEAVEYVRVCDAAGAGFFYIPGGDTCLKIGGYVRYQIGYADGIRGWQKETSARLEFSTWSDTEMGALTSYIRIEGKTVNDDGDYATEIAFKRATIGLGGLSMGYSATAYDGGLDDEIASGGGSEVNFISYSFAGGNGMSATLSLEEETFDDNWVPNIVGKVSYSAGSIGVDAWVAYDDEDFGVAGSAGWSVKGRLSAAVGDAGSLKVLGTYNSNNNFYANGGTWTLGASYAHKVNDKLTLTAGVQYVGDTGYVAGSPDTVLLDVVAAYTVVPGFTASAYVGYDTNAEAASGWLRFQRSF